MNETTAIPFLRGTAGPRFEAALKLHGFPSDSLLVICLPKDGPLPETHVDACCCVCGADVKRSQLSLHLDGVDKRVAVACVECIKKCLDDARRMGAA